jgi:hypothetical protein
MTTPSKIEPASDQFYEIVTLPARTASMVFWAEREGLLSPETDIPRLDRSKYLTWRAGVHELLESRGIVAAYNAFVMSQTRPAACPFWCDGKHEAFVTSADLCSGLAHKSTPITVRFESEDKRPTEAVITVAAWESVDDGVEEPLIDIAGEIGGTMTSEEAESLAAALHETSELLKVIRAKTQATAQSS